MWTHYTLNQMCSERKHPVHTYVNSTQITSSSSATKLVSGKLLSAFFPKSPPQFINCATHSLLNLYGSAIHQLWNSLTFESLRVHFSNIFWEAVWLRQNMSQCWCQTFLKISCNSLLAFWGVPSMRSLSIRMAYVIISGTLPLSFICLNDFTDSFTLPTLQSPINVLCMITSENPNPV